jgi:hypothetical protein
VQPVDVTQQRVRVRAGINAVEGGMTRQFVVEVENLGHLKKVMRKIRRVKGVLSVERKESFGDSDLTLAGHVGDEEGDD